MTDYGRQVRFGYFLIPNAADPLLATAREVERLGLDYIGVQDHPYQRRFVDTWTLLAMIAAATSRVGLFPDVANLPLRPPAVLAKAAGSLDVLSGGRVELGLGAGAFWDAIEAFGDRHLAGGVRAEGAAAGGPGGRRLGAVVPRRAATPARHGGPAGRGRGRGGTRPG